jgi:hypothetical protein
MSKADLETGTEARFCPTKEEAVNAETEVKVVRARVNFILISRGMVRFWCGKRRSVPRRRLSAKADNEPEVEFGCGTPHPRRRKQDIVA